MAFDHRTRCLLSGVVHDEHLELIAREVRSRDRGKGCRKRIWPTVGRHDEANGFQRSG